MITNSDESQISFTKSKVGKQGTLDTTESRAQVPRRKHTMMTGHRGRELYIIAALLGDNRSNSYITRCHITISIIFCSEHEYSRTHVSVNARALIFVRSYGSKMAIHFLIEDYNQMKLIMFSYVMNA